MKSFVLLRSDELKSKVSSSSSSSNSGSFVVEQIFSWERLEQPKVIKTHRLNDVCWIRNFSPKRI